MGRKVEMKKIEDITKCQVTFSKRRSSLMKKANEISVCCGVDVAFITFSPSGRVSKYCNHKRIEEVLYRYVNLPTDKRYSHIKNVQEKQDKLHQLDHMKNDTSKLQYLDKQIENLELQNKKCALELQIMEADMRDFETFSEQEPSLHQLMWCEKNLRQSLERVINRKNGLLSGYPSSSSFQTQPVVEGNNLGGTEIIQQNVTQSINPFNVDIATNPNWVGAPTENPTIGNGSGQLLMQLDPWISPFSAKIRESIFQDLVEGELPSTLPSQSLTQNNFGFTTDMEINYQQPPIVNEVLQPLPNAIETFDYQMNFPMDNEIVTPSVHPNYDHLANSSYIFNNNSRPSSSNVTQPPYDGGNITLPMYESYTFTPMPSTNGSTWLNPTTSNEMPSHFDMGWIETQLMENNEDFGQSITSEMVPLNQTHDSRVTMDQGSGSKEVMHMVDNSTAAAPLDQVDNIGIGGDNEWSGGIQAASLWEWEDLLAESFNADDLAKLF